MYPHCLLQCLESLLLLLVLLLQRAKLSLLLFVDNPDLGVGLVLAAAAEGKFVFAVDGDDNLTAALLLLLLLLDSTRVLFFFAGASLAGDTFSFLSTDLSSLFPRLDTLLSRRRPSMDDAADKDLDGGPLLLFLALRTGDGDSSLFSLTLRIGDGDSRRRLTGESAAGVTARGRLDDDVEDPADSPFSRVSFLLIPLILVPTASGSARPYRSCPG
jgi:hypothetical protein